MSGLKPWGLASSERVSSHRSDDNSLQLSTGTIATRRLISSEGVTMDLDGNESMCASHQQLAGFAATAALTPASTCTATPGGGGAVSAGKARAAAGTPPLPPPSRKQQQQQQNERQQQGVAEEGGGTALRHAAQMAARLHALLRCHACDSALPHARPWRSRNCEHVVCGVCAAVMRGRPCDGDNKGAATTGAGPIPRPRPGSGTAVMSGRGATVSGRCLVVGCGVPVCPADVVEDVGVWQVVDACAALSDWAERYASLPAAATGGQGCDRDGGVALSCAHLFDSAA